MPKKKKTKKKKRRNHLAVIARIRTGAGPHGNGRPDKEESRNACRKKVRLEDHLDD